MQVRRIVLAGRISRTGDRHRRFAEDLAERLGAETVVLWGARSRDLKAYEYGEGDLLIAKAVPRAGVTTLVPFDESGLLDRGLEKRVLIPLSNDESGYRVTEEVLPIVAKLGFTIVYWHTTWRQKENPSADPADHVCTEAAVMIGRAERLATDAGIAHVTVIETADTVEYGIVQAALDRDCALIVMTRGRENVRGSYVQRVLERSPVPVLSLGRNGGDR